MPKCPGQEQSAGRAQWGQEQQNLMQKGLWGAEDVWEEHEGNWGWEHRDGAGSMGIEWGAWSDTSSPA